MIFHNKIFKLFNPKLLYQVYMRYCNIIKSYSKFNFFKKVIIENYTPLNISFKLKNIGLIKENPDETPDHYMIYSYWVINKIKNKKNLNILDVGGTKILNMVNSINHNVYALVLKKPIDGISSVHWIEHDISNPLPFSDNFFDVFTSPGTLQLVGLGRYGDIENPLALLNLLEELKRVMKKNSKLYLLLPLGQDQFIYGLHFIYSFETIQKIFGKIGAQVTDFMVDEYIKIGFSKSFEIRKNFDRFSKNTNVKGFKDFQYKIIYLELTLYKKEI